MSDLPDELLDYVEERFEGDHPTVDVRLVRATDEDALEHLRSRSGQIDVWWGGAGPVLAAAAADGLLLGQGPGGEQPDRDGRWQISLVSPFVVAFNRERVPLARAPRDWIDLFHFRWHQEITLLDPTRNPDMATFVGSMIVEALRDDDDLTRAYDWLRRLDGNAGEYAADTEAVIRRLGTGEASLTILPRHVVEEARHGDAPWIHYRLPESGTPVLSRGIAIAADAQQPDLARAFVALTGTVDVSTQAKLATRWTSGSGEVDTARVPEDFEIDVTWNRYTPSPDTLATELVGWLERWELEVRGRGDA